MLSDATDVGPALAQVSKTGRHRRGMLTRGTKTASRGRSAAVPVSAPRGA